MGAEQTSVPMDAPSSTAIRIEHGGGARGKMGGAAFSEIHVFTGSTDESGAFLRWAAPTCSE